MKRRRARNRPGARQRAVAGIVLAWIGTAIACVPSGERPGGTVEAYLTKDVPSLTLLGKADKNGEILAYQVTDSLVQFNADLELEPRVAESWEFSDDRKTLTFRLRDGVRWHDGEPVTADDVRFTVETVQDPATENRSFQPLFSDLVKIETPDRLTVHATYSQLKPDDVLEAWRVPLLPRHLAAKEGDLFKGEFARHPTGCGPFRFVSHSPSQRIVLEANDDYWDGRPSIDRLVFNIFDDQRTAYLELLKGNLDIMNLSTSLWLEAQRSERADELEARAYYRLNVWYFAWNQDGSNPFFDDTRVRRAMMLALDRQAFIDGPMEGLGLIAVTSYHPQSWWTDPDLSPLPHAPEEAMRLLDDAGWVDSDGDGIRDRNGTPFRFSMLLPASNQRISDSITAWAQASWRRIGIDCEIEKLEWQALRVQRDSGQYQAVTGSLNFTPAPDVFEIYHSSSRDHGYNFFGLDDPEVDRLIEQGRTLVDNTERREIYHRLQRRLHELQPISPVVHFPTPVLQDRRLQGVVLTPIDYYRISAGPRLWTIRSERLATGAADGCWRPAGMEGRPPARV